MKKNLSWFLVIAVLGMWLRPLVVLANTDAVNYLKGKTINDWSAMALASAGEAVSATSLQTFSGSVATDYAKRILAVAAASENPNTFAGLDLVTGLKNKYTSNQIGEATLLNDDFWGILALRAAGLDTTDSVITGAKNFILAHQNSDGGFSYSTTGESDTNDTSAAIMALLEAGVSQDNAVIVQAKSYLLSTQNNNAGWGYAGSAESDSGSTAWVIAALNKLGESLNSWQKNSLTPSQYLLTLQNSDGGFKWQAGDSSSSEAMTAFAVVALSNSSWPVKKYVASSSGDNTVGKVSYRFEGASGNVCSGLAEPQNAMQLIETVATTCNFTYEIKTSSFGRYLNKINNEEAAGMSGWMYLVNYTSPSVGAEQYNLQAGDDLLWYYGDWGIKPLRLTANKTTLASNESINLTVEAYDEIAKAWQIATGVKINGVSGDLVSNSQGQVIVSLSDGQYSLSASATGYIRSKVLSIQVGSGSSNSNSLSLVAEVPGRPTVEGSQTVAFTISSSQVNFGKLTYGQVNRSSFTVNNLSQNTLHLATQVTGDLLFTGYLKLDDQTWENWRKDVTANQNSTINMALNLPQNYNGQIGSRQGTMVVWAISQP